MYTYIHTYVFSFSFTRSWTLKLLVFHSCTPLNSVSINMEGRFTSEIQKSIFGAICLGMWYWDHITFEEYSYSLFPHEIWKVSCLHTFITSCSLSFKFCLLFAALGLNPRPYAWTDALHLLHFQSLNCPHPLCFLVWGDTALWVWFANSNS